MSSMPEPQCLKSDVDSTLKRIADLYPALTTQLRKAADYVLENPLNIALLPIRKSSDEAGVTPSTMTRLAKTLGFERYNTFKDVFKQAIHAKVPVNYGSRAQSLQALSGPSSSNKVFKEFAEAAFKDLEQLFNDETLSSIQSAATMILQAKTIYVLGFRDAFACAHHFAYVGRIALPNIMLIRGNEGDLLSELGKISKDDVVVAFGSEPYAIETVNSINIVKQQEGRLITITDDLRSPLSAGADVVLTVETDTPHFFPSILSTIALVEALVAECVTMGGAQMVENISSFEESLHRLGGYYSPKR